MSTLSNAKQSLLFNRLSPALLDRAVTVASSKGVKGARTDICHNNDSDCLTQQSSADLQHTCLKSLHFSFLLCLLNFGFQWLIVEHWAKQRTLNQWQLFFSSSLKRQPLFDQQPESCESAKIEAQHQQNEQM